MSATNTSNRLGSEDSSVGEPVTKGGSACLVKRKYGLRTTPSRAGDGLEAWIGWGILAHNLDKLAAKM